MSNRTPRPLRGGVGADRLGNGIRLRERDRGSVAVDARTAGEDEPADPVLPGRLQQMSGAFHVDPGVVGRLLDARPDPRHRRQVEDGGGPGSVEEAVDAIAVNDVDLLDLQGAGQAAKVHLLPAAVVEVGEVIDPDDLVSLFQEGLGGMRTDETGGARDQDRGAGGQAWLGARLSHGRFISIGVVRRGLPVEPSLALGRARR